jgi:hypothetical protein
MPKSLVFSLRRDQDLEKQKGTLDDVPVTKYVALNFTKVPNLLRIERS